jgi:hypothetical protein
VGIHATILPLFVVGVAPPGLKGGNVMNRTRTAGRGSALLTAVILGVLVVGAVVVAGSVWKMPFTTSVEDHSAPPVLLDLRNLADYHAAQAQFEVVVDQEKDVKWVPQFIAGERAQYIAVGTVDAVIDFTSLPDGAVTVSADGTSATIVLPPPTLVEPVLDLETSHVMNRDRGVINRVSGVFTDNPTSDQPLMQAATEKMATAASRTDLRERAQENTANMLRGLLTGLGFETVDIRFETSPS